MRIILQQHAERSATCQGLGAQPRQFWRRAVKAVIWYEGQRAAGTVTCRAALCRLPDKRNGSRRIRRRDDARSVLAQRLRHGWRGRQAKDHRKGARPGPGNERHGRFGLEHSFENRFVGRKERAALCADGSH